MKKSRRELIQEVHSLDQTKATGLLCPAYRHWIILPVQGL